jgi:hypothetical protein
MRREPIMALAAAVLLGGCVYDPYTGSYEPCCAYPGPYAYSYPPQPVPYAAPPAAGQPGPEYAPPPPQPGAEYTAPPGQPPGAPPQQPRVDRLAQRFAAANVTHDGRLTRQHAAVGMPAVAREFDAIDVQHKGFVTLDEIRAFRAAQHRMQGAPPPPG